MLHIYGLLVCSNTVVLVCTHACICSLDLVIATQYNIIIPISHLSHLNTIFQLLLRISSSDPNQLTRFCLDTDVFRLILALDTFVITASSINGVQYSQLDRCRAMMANPYLDHSQIKFKLVERQNLLPIPFESEVEVSNVLFFNVLC